MEDQTLKQKKIILAQSEHAPVIIELMRDCLSQTPLIADTEWKTIVNTITLDTESSMMRKMVDLLEGIRQGSLHEEK